MSSRAVINSTGTAQSCERTAAASPNPSKTGIIMSLITMSNFFSANFPSASAPFKQPQTSYPSEERQAHTSLLRFSSSSAMRIFTI